MSRGTISQIESGETLKPTTDVLFPLAAALGMPAEDLAAAAGSVPPRARGPVAYDTWEALQDLVMKDPDLTRDEKRNVIGVLKSIVMPMLQQARRRARTG